MAQPVTIENDAIQMDVWPTYGGKVSSLVDNQAIVIPETIDAIRALAGQTRNAAASIQQTNISLGIGPFDFLQAADDARVIKRGKSIGAGSGAVND